MTKRSLFLRRAAADVGPEATEAEADVGAAVAAAAECFRSKVSGPESSSARTDTF